MEKLKPSGFEEWRDIKGYEGRYQVSNMGRVKTVERFKSDGRHQSEGIRKTQLDFHGYEFALLYNGHKMCRHSVHVLVANAFIPNPEHKPQVNHIDGNKTNNVVDNLEWVTASENQLHAIAHGLVIPKRGDATKRTKVSDADVLRIRELRKTGEKLQHLADMFGLSLAHVGRIVNNERRVLD